MAEPPYSKDRAMGEEGFFDHARLLAASVAAYIHARLSLAGIESKEALGHYLILAIWLGAAVMVTVFGYIFLCAAGIFLIADLLSVRWVWVTLGCAVVHLGFAAWCLWMVRRKLAVPTFSATINEFKKDQEWLKTPKPN